jgi:uncharacterized protein
MRNAIEWFDIPSHDFERALKFYSTILGEELKVINYEGQKLAMFPMDEDGNVGGDLVPPSEEFVPSKQGTRVYLNCDGKLDEVIARIESSGGRIIKPKFSIPDADIVIIEDTEGNTVGLSSMKAK